MTSVAQLCREPCPYPPIDVGQSGAAEEMIPILASKLSKTQHTKYIDVYGYIYACIYLISLMAFLERGIA